MIPQYRLSWASPLVQYAERSWDRGPHLGGVITIDWNIKRSADRAVFIFQEEGPTGLAAWDVTHAGRSLGSHHSVSLWQL